MIAYPELNLARRVLEKYQLRPPVDMGALTDLYSTVEILSLPLDIDGVCFNLKVSGKRPTIFVNDTRPRRRKRFTLAHELGHVLIPWHVGVIVDEIDLRNSDKDSSYWELENEANRFAAELLMPQHWINEIINGSDNPCEMLENVAETAEVSWSSAVIKLINTLEAGYIYVLLAEDGRVVSSGRSADTLAGRPQSGTLINVKKMYPASDQRWEVRHRDELYVWWHFPAEVELPTATDSREWRQVLNDIVSDLALGPAEAQQIKQTVNAIVACANSHVTQMARRGNMLRTVEAVYAASMQRFDSRAQQEPALQQLVTHPYFSTYVSKRAQHLVNR